MLKRALSTIALFAGLCLPALAAPIVLYQNGTLDGTTGARDITSYVVSNSLTLSRTGLLQSVTIGTWTDVGTTLSTVGWAITTGPLLQGTVLGAGTATPTSVYQFDNSRPNSVNLATFSLPDILLGPGTYYLTLHTASSSTATSVFWDQAGGSPTSTAYEGIFGQVPSSFFIIEGQVPELNSATALAPLSFCLLLLLTTQVKRRAAWNGPAES